MIGHRRALALALSLSLATQSVWAQQSGTIPPPTTLQQDQAEKAQEKLRDQFRVNGSNTGGSSGGKKNGEKLLGKFGKDLDIYGNWILTSRSNQVSGSDAARQWFNYQNNNSFFNTSSFGPFQQNLDVTLVGSVFNVVKVNASLTNNRILSQTSLAQLLGFEYESKDKRTKAAVGDVNATLPGNELVSFSRRLVGMQYQRDLGGNRNVTTLASITRALTRRGSFQGQGTTGPYYLNASQIVPGSEKVYLNGQQLTAYEDYDLDYLLGTIRFKKSRIINREDTVEFTYEAQNYNTSAGVLTGLRYEGPLAARTLDRMGFTILRQTSAGGGASGKPVTQYFPVSGDVSSRYTLAAPIEPNTTIEVRYQERLLVEGATADYIVNRDLQYIQLRVPFPADTALLGISSLSVRYTPIKQLGIAGDKEVMGIDTSLTPSKTSKVAIQFGQSKGITASQNGTGVTITTNLRSPEKAARPWTAQLAVRDIGSTFSGIESTSGAFLRAEQGYRANLGFRPTANLDVSTQLSDTRITPSQTSSTGSTSTSLLQNKARNQSVNTTLSWTPPETQRRRLPRLQLTHLDTTQNTLSTSSSSTSTTTSPSKATFTSDRLSATYDFPGGNTELSFSRTGSKGRSVFAYGYTDTVGTGSGSSSGGFLGGYRDGTTGSTSTNSTSSNALWRVSLTPSERISVSGSLGYSRSNTAGSRTNQNDSSIDVTYTPIPDKVQVTASLSDSGNGQNLSGFYNSGSTIGGNDSLSIGGLSTGQRTRSSTFSTSITPNQRLRLDLRRMQTLSLIPGYDNTQSGTTDATFDYALQEKIRLMGQWSSQKVTYVGNQGNSDNQNYILAANAGPYKRTNYQFNIARMNYGSALGSFGSGTIGGGIGGIGGGLGGGTLTGFGQQGLTTTVTLRTGYQVGPAQPFLDLRYLNATAPATTGTGTGTGTIGSSTFHSSTNYRSLEARLGLDWNLTNVLTATLDMRLLRLKDRDDPRYNYNARILNFDLRARFN